MLVACAEDFTHAASAQAIQQHVWPDAQVASASLSDLIDLVARQQIATEQDSPQGARIGIVGLGQGREFVQQRRLYQIGPPQALEQRGGPVASHRRIPLAIEQTIDARWSASE
jgi:hypothetical protein